MTATNGSARRRNGARSAPVITSYSIHYTKLYENFDARWEWYPSFGELVSVALFTKHFDRPIEQVDVATSGVSQLSFINAESAFNYGISYNFV